MLLFVVKLSHGTFWTLQKDQHFPFFVPVLGAFRSLSLIALTTSDQCYTEVEIVHIPFFLISAGRALVFSSQRQLIIQGSLQTSSLSR